MLGGRRRAGLSTLAVAATLTAALAAPTAQADDSLYWSNSLGPIRYGSLTATTSAQTLFTDPDMAAAGIAIDTAAGKIYWVGINRIWAGNLDGSGTPQPLVEDAQGTGGLAIDPVGGRLYWVTFGPGLIRTANLDGSGGAQTLYTGEASPGSIAVDPARGRLYWSNENFPNPTGAIRVGSLDGSSPPQDLFAGEPQPFGVAIDSGAGRIYWTSGANIRVANLDGTGFPANLYTGESVGAIALDPVAGKIYWSRSNGSIRIGNLNGSGTAQNQFAGETDPRYPAVLRAPIGTSAPELSGPGTAGQLACSPGGWAPDLVGSNFYRSPTSFNFEWLDDGAAIPGANQSTFTPIAGGDYACRVTASNQAGPAQQTSATLSVPQPPATLDRKSSYKLNRKGVFVFGFSAPPGLGGTAIFREKKKGGAGGKQRRAAKLAKKKFTVGPIGRVKIRPKLSKKAFRAATREGILRSRATVNLSDAAGRSSSATKTIRLKAPKGR